MQNNLSNFLAKVAQEATPFKMEFDASNVDLSNPKAYGEAMGKNFGEWGHRVDTPEFAQWEQTNPVDARNVRQQAAFAAERARNPSAQYTPQFNVTNAPGWTRGVDALGKGVVDEYSKAWDAAWKDGLSPTNAWSAAKQFGTNVYDRASQLWNAADPNSPERKQIQDQIQSGFYGSLDRNSPAMRHYTTQGATNYMSNKFKDWTKNWGSFGGGVNSILQFLLGLLSRAPGYETVTNWAANTFGGRDMFGAPKTASFALPAPYSHYRRVATMPCGAEVLERWNQS